LKKKLGIIIFLVIVIVSCYFIQNVFHTNEEKNAKVELSSTPASRIIEAIEPSNTFVEKRGTVTQNNQTIHYLLIFPSEYTKTTNQWPMILFLHGSSLRGQNLELVKEYGSTWFAEQRNDFPFIVLAPQCPENENWENKPEILAALLDEVLKKYRIDQDRIYLTGTSIGGRGTWSLACHHPEYFAAISPIAAVNPIIPTAWNKQMISMPIWAFHGEKDTIAPLKNDEAIIGALRNQGGSPRFTILPNQGHNIAGVYKNPELYDWFLSHSRLNK